MAGSGEAVDEDRLPWLESVDETYEEGPSTGRVVLLVLLGLVVLAAIIFAYYRSQRPAPGPDGNGQLIAAPKEPYRVKPEQPGGMKVEGQGDTAFATSQGSTNPNAAINLNAVPEKPIDGKRAAAPAGKPNATASTSVAAVPQASGQLKAANPNATQRSTVGAGGAGSVVQLGSFPSESGANAAWTSLSKRFNYLAPLAKQVQAADVNGSKTYRLRVDTGSAAAAQTLCGKLKVAGEACFVPSA